MIYQLSNDPRRNVLASILKKEGDSIEVIPLDPANTDYQAYLKWLADGNTPLPAENS